jgi:serine protease AprX
LHGHRVEALFNIRVLNLSLGRAIYESYKLDPVCQAVEAAWKSGIVVVVAAGNNGRYQPTDGYGTITSPGNDPYVITVGAMKPMGTPTRVDDLIASYSSKGPTAIDAVVKPDIVAPGNLLVSLEAPGSTLTPSIRAIASPTTTT